MSNKVKQNYFGLTGGIGAGKSTVAKRLHSLGAVVLDADAFSRRALDTDGCCYSDVLRLFGSSICLPDGRIDRKAVAKRIFTDESLRRSLNEIVHPAVRQQMLLCAADVDDCIPVIFDVPLLFESGWHRMMRENIVVTAPEADCIHRVCLRDGCTQAQVRERIAAQMPQAQKVLLADHELKNDGDLESLYADTDALFRVLVEKLKGSEHA